MSRDFTRILVACMPKSGSTYLSTLISCLPGMRRVHLVPSYQRREQELDQARVNLEEEETARLRGSYANYRQPGFSDVEAPLDAGLVRGYVAQHHVRYSRGTEDFIEKFNVIPVVLVRDIFDVIVSLRDHIISTSPFMSMVYVTEEMRTWPKDKLEILLADMAVPWYFNFYVSWQNCPKKILIRYEDLREHPGGVVRQVMENSPVSAIDRDITDAIEKSKGKNTRKNKGVVGRGRQLDPAAREIIMNYKSYYPDIDFSPIGL